MNRSVIVITLEDLLSDPDEICRLAKKEDIVMILNNGKNEVTPNNSLRNNEAALLAVNHSNITSKAKHNSQKGFSMIELLVAVTIISITMLAVGALSSLSATGIALVQRKRAAENKAVELTAKLRAQQKVSLPAGGAFAVNPQTGEPTRNAQGGVTLNCSAAYCDRVVTIPSSMEGKSATEKVIGWDEAMPSEATHKFTRAWNVRDEDATRNWRGITVAIFPADSSIPATFSVTGGVIK